MCIDSIALGFPESHEIGLRENKPIPSYSNSVIAKPDQVCALDAFYSLVGDYELVDTLSDYWLSFAPAASFIFKHLVRILVHCMAKSTRRTD